MSPRKKTFTIDDWVENIFNLNLPEDDAKHYKTIQEAASKFITKTKLELKQLSVAALEAEVELKDKKHSTIDLLELHDIDLQIQRQAIKRSIYESAIKLREQSYYRRPTSPMGTILTDNGIYSVSPSKKRASKHNELANTVGVLDEDGVVVKSTSKATVYHPANKELTLQDAKVLIAVHKVWEESGKQKYFEVPIYELAKKIGRNTSGRTYNQIWNSLATIYDTSIQLQYSYESGQIKEMDRFKILQRIGARGDVAKLEFSDVLYNSLQSGALIHISLAILEDLPSNSAQGLYPFIASQVAKGIDTWEVKEICSLLGFKSPSFKRQQDMLHDACTDMVECGLLNSFQIYDDHYTLYLQIEPTEILLQTKKLFEQKQSQLL